jgi:hypothetical protein
VGPEAHPHNAKAVAALLNDAIDDEACTANPFRNRRQEQPRGRQDIYPLTEEEVDRLADCALRHWGGGVRAGREGVGAVRGVGRLEARGDVRR